MCSLARYLVFRQDEPSGCYHCVDRPEDTVQHTVEVCPAWAEYRRVLQEAIGGADLSRPALVEAMVDLQSSNASKGGGGVGPGDA